jgi:hypothetical protein
MFCPQCGQQQVSVETRFCSRCGFQLGLVSQLLAYGGFLPQLADLGKKKKFLNKKTGVIGAIFWIILFLMLIPALFAIAGEDDGAAVSAVIGIFGGMMLLIGSLALLPSSKSVELPVAAELPQGLHGQMAHGALPPRQTQPASSYVQPGGAWRAPNTGDFASPGSVTDNTTKLLNHDE